ncbi:MAG: DNA ligase D [Armatimonadota bacterium]
MPEHEADSLREYRRRRDFSRTPEPEGELASPAAAPRFVVHEHSASSHHYDLRLEIGGTLASWAVPTGPSFDPDVTRLAIRTEDHPLLYAGFEGVIPEGQYGAGEVIVWDRGTFHSLKDEDGPSLEEGLAEGHLTVWLDGEKLTGGWALFRTDRDDGDRWLLKKMKDEKADREVDVTAERPESVISGRTIAELQQQSAAGDDLFGGLPEGARENLIRAEQPEWIEPMLATLTDRRFSDPEWVFERKLDGERCIAYRQGDSVRLMSRNRRLINDAYPELVEAIAEQALGDFVVDGEIVAFDEQGRTSFSRLQRRMHVQDPAKARRTGVEVRYYLFDILHLSGRDTTRLGLLDRKRLLAAALDFEPPLVLTDHRREHGEALYEEACEADWEGLIAKDASARYQGGRSRAWLKFKCVRQQEFVIVGWTDPGGSRAGFGALLLGYHEGGELRYAGKVGTGFSEEQLRSIHRRLRELERDEPAVAGGDLPRDAHWAEPELVAEVGYSEWLESDRLRHPRFLGIREDIDPEDAVRERPETPGRQPPEPAALSHEIEVSNADKVLFRDAGITKRQFVDYYRHVAGIMLPHLRGRPISMLRFPDGPAGETFFQKDIPDFFPEWIERVTVGDEDEGEAITYCVAENPDTLVYLANLVAVLHIWTSRREALFRPDRMVFDLDPPEGGQFQAVISAARTIRTLLEEIGLSAFVMTTGSRGLHVVTPLQPTREVAEVADFARRLAGVVARNDPDNLTTEHRKAKRGGRLLIDAWRNSRGQTSVAPYSARARPGAPVATPLDWEELDDPETGPQRWTVANILDRLAERGDPWADIDRRARDLAEVVDELMG